MEIVFLPYALHGQYLLWLNGQWSSILSIRLQTAIHTNRQWMRRRKSVWSSSCHAKVNKFGTAALWPYAISAQGCCSPGRLPVAMHANYGQSVSPVKTRFPDPTGIYPCARVYRYAMFFSSVLECAGTCKMWGGLSSFLFRGSPRFDAHVCNVAMCCLVFKANCGVAGRRVRVLWRRWIREMTSPCSGWRWR